MQIVEVTNVRCHVGIQIGARVYNALDSKKDNFEMAWQVNAPGIRIRYKIKGKTKTFTAPISCVASFESEDYEWSIPEKTLGTAKASASATKKKK